MFTGEEAAFGIDHQRTLNFSKNSLAVGSTRTNTPLALIASAMAAAAAAAPAAAI
jgi:hypothetical protein